MTWRGLSGIGAEYIIRRAVAMKQAQEALFCLAVGGAFLLAAAVMWLRTRLLVARSSPAWGEVIELREYHGKGVRYIPVIRFTGPDGQPVIFTESTASNPPDHQVGDRVKVLYRRDDPGRARVATASNLYLLTMIFTCLGVVIVTVGILIAPSDFYR